MIDTGRLQVAATPKTGKGAHDVVVSPDGSRVYVTNIYDNSISVIDVAANQVLETLPVGKWPQRNQLQPRHGKRSCQSRSSIE